MEPFNIALIGCGTVGAGVVKLLTHERERLTARAGRPLALKRIVIKWRNEFMPDLKAEGYTRCTIEIEPQGDVMKLSVTHEAEKQGANKFIDAVSGGWPQILASLKSLLETGKALPRTDRLPEK